MDLPRTLGRFRIEAELGAGALGPRYLGRDPEGERPVVLEALRVAGDLPPDRLSELRQRFLGEVESARRLSHEGLLAVDEAGAVDGMLYVAAEHVDGASLASRLASGQRLAPARVAELVAQVGAALDHAHRHDRVHGAVRPDNVWLDRTGGGRLCGLGVPQPVAAALAGRGPLPDDPGYLAPEQITGHPLSGATDQHALGVVAYEALTGKRPFAGADPTAVLYRIVHEPAPTLREARPDLPAALEAVVGRALEKDSGRRYASCADFAAALRDAAGHGSFTASAAELESLGTIVPGLGPPVDPTAEEAAGAEGDPSERLRPWVGPALLAGGALVILLVGSFWLPGDDEPMVALEEAASGDLAVLSDTAAEEAAPTTGTYRIETRPEGARVTLDGRALRGVTPLSVALDPATRHTILLEIPGHEPVLWAFVPEDLGEGQRTSGRLFFPLRERAAGSTVAEAGAEAERAPARAAVADDVPDLEAPPYGPVDPIRIRRGVTRPEVLQKFEPPWPDWADAEDLDLPRYVVLEAVIDRHGRVREARPLSSVHPLLESEALRAVRRWRLSPARRDGVPVDVYYNLTVVFGGDDADGGA